MTLSHPVNSPPPTLATWMPIAGQYLGVREDPSARSHPQIVKWLQRLPLPPSMHRDETAWCSAFVDAVMSEAGYDGTRDARARSWLNWGLELPQPRFGAPTVLWRTDPASWEGHVALYLGRIGSQIALLGGNQDNEVCVKLYPVTRVLQHGYRWPGRGPRLPLPVPAH